MYIDLLAGAAVGSRVVTTSVSGLEGVEDSDLDSREESALDNIMLKISSSRNLILSRMVCKWCWETWIVVSWLSSAARAAINFGAW